MGDEENQSSQECPSRDENTELETNKELALQSAKREKRNAKSALTRLLSTLTTRLSDRRAKKDDIIEVLERIERQKDEVFLILDRMEQIYTKLGDKTNVEKVTDEGEVINDQVSNETYVARKCILSSKIAQKISASSSRRTSVADKVEESQMAQQPFRVPEAQQHFERASPKLIELEDKELERRGSDIELTLIRPVDEQCDMFHVSEENYANYEKNDRNASNHRDVDLDQMTLRDAEYNYASKEKNVRNVTRDLSPRRQISGEQLFVDKQSELPSRRKTEPNSQLERIRIPKFEGDKLEFQQWYTAFISCVDETAMTSQFKMLRLEACLGGRPEKLYGGSATLK
jgi:hypothetical protein